MSGFYQIQNSNSKTFADNTASHFRTKLPEVLDFTGYEVAALSALCQPALKTILNERMTIFTLGKGPDVYRDHITNLCFDKKIPMATEEQSYAQISAKFNLSLKKILESIKTNDSMIEVKGVQLSSDAADFGEIKLSLKNKSNTHKAFYRYVATDESVGKQDTLKIAISEDDYRRFVQATKLASVPRNEIFVIEPSATRTIPFSYLNTDESGRKLSPQSHIKDAVIHTYSLVTEGKELKSEHILQPGAAYCETPKVLVEYLNKVFSKPKVVKFSFDDLKRQIIVEQKNHEIEIDLGDFQFILGFRDRSILKKNNQDIHGKWIGEMSPNLTRGIQSVYIYSNVADYIVVTDKKVPLLCEFALPPKVKYGERMEITMQNPMYVPCTSGFLNELEFQIFDDAGEEAKFLVGKVTLCLHFRKRNV